ncbi:MAG: CRISPR-associated ring nuclease Crn3/Csx3 [Cyanobacteria bacterium P01_A01_bin.123]
MLSSNALHPVQLNLTLLSSHSGSLQTLAITLNSPVVHPDCLPTLKLPPEINLTREVVLYGRSPTWLYGALIHKCQAAPWLGCYDARSQAVIVIHSRVESPAIGDRLPVTLNRQPCPAILIGGPPNSGKSVLSNATRLSLTAQLPNDTIYLHRASWDGEGNWTYETAQPSFVEALVRNHEYRIHEDPETAKLIPGFFQSHADAVANLRNLVDCLLVDVGGLPQREKVPLVEQCSHYMIISRLPEAVDVWHQFCQPHLKPIAVIHSVLSDEFEVLQTTPWLEIKAGPWLMGATQTIPDILLKHILNAIQQSP